MSKETVVSLFKGATIVGIITLIILRPEAFRTALAAAVGVIADVMKLGG